jgi:RES domain-containing protein
MELFRIIESQNGVLYPYRATQNGERARQLELLLENTKPENLYPEWHTLIATPFRYSPPHAIARFRPAYGKNIFYGSALEETALYEHAFHFMRQRLHLAEINQNGTRTIFSVEANTNHSINLKDYEDCSLIMNKNDYGASHQFIANKASTFIIYPSCRDPQQRENAAILDIKHLNKTLEWQTPIHFFYDNEKHNLHWLEYDLAIEWVQVA